MKNTMVAIGMIILLASCGGREKIEVTLRLSADEYLQEKYPSWFGPGEGLESGNVDESIRPSLMAEIEEEKIKALDVLGRRLTAISEPLAFPASLFSKPEVEIKETGEPDTWTITINRKIDPGKVTEILEARVNLSFWETYDLSEIWDQINQANTILRDPEIAAILGVVPDSLESLNENPLFRFLNPNITNEGEIRKGCVIGYSKASDREMVEAMLHFPEVGFALPRNLTTLWSAGPFYGTDDIYELYALNVSSATGEPLMTDEYIVEATVESAGYGPTIDFTLSSEGARLWEQITEQNLNRNIAVVMNGSVLFAPVVSSVIREGKSSISADFTEEEAERLAVLIGSGQNRFGVKVTAIN